MKFLLHLVLRSRHGQPMYSHPVVPPELSKMIVSLCLPGFSPSLSRLFLTPKLDFPDPSRFFSQRIDIQAIWKKRCFHSAAPNHRFPFIPSLIYRRNASWRRSGNLKSVGVGRIPDQRSPQAPGRRSRSRCDEAQATDHWVHRSVSADQPGVSAAPAASDSSLAPYGRAQWIRWEADDARAADERADELQ